jgi:ATP-dependent DNA helicase RecQ
MEPGIQVLDAATPIRDLPVDWRAMQARRGGDERKLKWMQGYAYHERCRRGYVLRYFGDPAAMDECGACDNCLERAPGSSHVPIVPGAEEPVAGDSAVPVRGRRERAPRERRAPTAAPSSEAEERRFHELKRLRADFAERAGVPPYFVFKEETLRELAGRCPTTPEALLEVPGIGARTAEKYGLTLLNALRAERGEPALHEMTRRPRAPARGGGAADGPASAAESELYARLRELRAELARRDGVPAYCVFHDRTLVEIARVRPATEAELLEVPGIGPAKLEKYGAELLEALARDPA